MDLAKLIDLAEKYDYKPDDIHLSNLTEFVADNASSIAALCKDYAALQQKLDAVVAELTLLKSGFSFFMYSDDSGFETYKTEAEAIAAANEMIGCCREDAGSDGWPEDTEAICWGVIRQQAVECDYQKASDENGWAGWCDYKLSPETQTADALLNALRAEGVELLAKYMGANDTRMSVTPDALIQYAAQLRAGDADKDGK